MSRRSCTSSDAQLWTAPLWRNVLVFSTFVSSTLSGLRADEFAHAGSKLRRLYRVACLRCDALSRISMRSSARETNVVSVLAFFSRVLRLEIGNASSPSVQE